MVSYKSVFSKLFSHTSVKSSDPSSSPNSQSPYRAGPRRALSHPVLPSSKHDPEDLKPHSPRRPRVLVRSRPQSTNFASFDRPRNGIFSRSYSHLAHRPRTQPYVSSPVTAPVDGGSIVTLPLSSQPRSYSPSATTPSSTNATSQPEVSESCDIDLLLSPEPEDAKKVIIKRLEGLALALDMMHVGDTLTRANSFRKKRTITFGVESPTHFHQQQQQSATAASEFLSPIENWEDEDDSTNRNLFAYYCPPQPAVDDDTGSSSQSRFDSSSSDSTSSSCVSTNITDDSKPPITMRVTAAQYPLSFHLEPISQFTLDICKSTPLPVLPPEIPDRTSLVPVENVVIWDPEQQPP